MRLKSCSLRPGGLAPGNKDQQRHPVLHPAGSQPGRRRCRIHRGPRALLTLPCQHLAGAPTMGPVNLNSLGKHPNPDAVKGLSETRGRFRRISHGDARNNLGSVAARTTKTPQVSATTPLTAHCRPARSTGRTPTHPRYVRLRGRVTGLVLRGTVERGPRYRGLGPRLLFPRTAGDLCATVHPRDPGRWRPDLGVYPSDIQPIRVESAGRSMESARRSHAK
jgi:hypothetical protein